MCQTGVIGTLARVTLARRAWGSGLAVRAGVSWLALGPTLSWASIFAVSRQTSWTCGREGNN